jgi:hypothetical protein
VFERQIANGVKFLNERYPGWRERCREAISDGLFSMEDHCGCVAYHSAEMPYNEFAEKVLLNGQPYVFGDNTPMGLELGFEATAGVGTDTEWTTLEEEWRVEIRK